MQYMAYLFSLSPSQDCLTSHGTPYMRLLVRSWTLQECFDAIYEQVNDLKKRSLPVDSFMITSYPDFTSSDIGTDSVLLRMTPISGANISLVKACADSGRIFRTDQTQGANL